MIKKLYMDRYCNYCMPLKVLAVLNCELRIAQPSLKLHFERLVSEEVFKNKIITSR